MLTIVAIIMIVVAIVLFIINFVSAMGSTSFRQVSNAYDWIGLSEVLFAVGLVLLVISLIFPAH